MRLLRATEVAEILGCSRGEVYRLISLNRIPYVRLSERVVRVPEEALREFIRARTTGPKEGRR